MKAMVLREQGPAEDSRLILEDIPIPSHGEREILLRVRECGVCRTDLHIVEGELIPPSLPIVPGHQVVGEVVDSGESCGRFSRGDRVGVAWLHKACGTCLYCLRGHENLCENSLFTGFHVNGGFAEYITVSEAFAYAIPEGMDGSHAAPLLCAGIIGYRALRLSELPEGGKLGLFGFGASAHVCIQIAVHQGYSVYVFSRSPEHRELAAELGAVWTGDAGDKPPEKLDSAIVFAPAGEVVLPAMENLDRGGTCAIAGIHMTPIPELDYEKHLFHEKKLRSVTASTRKDGRELLREAAEAGVQTSVETFELEQVNEALVKLKNSEINGAGVLII